MKINKQTSLAEMIHRFASWQTATMNQQLHELSLNNDQANVIRYVAENPGMNQRAVADFLSRNGASVTNLLKSLEGKGLLERRFLANDVRTKHLFLTTQGQRANQRIQQLFSQLDSRVNSVLSDGQRHDAEEALIRLTDSLLGK